LKVFQSYKEFRSNKKTIITIGTFDGVHVGHQSIIKKLTEHNGAYESVLMTFFPHPRMVLNKHPEIKLLNTITEKSYLLEKSGLENLIIQPFDKDFAQLTALEFVKNILVDTLHIQKIIIGHDHRFGVNRSADIYDLIRFGNQFHFDVEQISAQEIKDVSVSSTKTRKALNEGQVSLANQYLGYDYLLSGKVIRGKGLGKTLQFPTANLLIEEPYKLIPQNGVYVVYAYLNHQKVWGMMNIGINPTVNGKEHSIEVHFLNFNQDLYGQTISVHLIERIRDEQKFDSLTELKNQLEKDKNTVLMFVQ
jgi:riboflavin kinase / FMN adenylyltransferase